MPFESKAQMGAAFGGYLGPEMKKKAKQWAGETPDISKLPVHKNSEIPGRRPVIPDIRKVKKAGK